MQFWFLLLASRSVLIPISKCAIPSVRLFCSIKFFLCTSLKGDVQGYFNPGLLFSLCSYLQMKSFCCHLTSQYASAVRHIYFGCHYSSTQKSLEAAFHPLVIIYMNFNDQNATSVDLCWCALMASSFQDPFFFPPPSSGGLQRERGRKFIQPVQFFFSITSEDSLDW